jgi:hypothetical protein
MMLEELQRRSYSQSTTRAYVRVVRELAAYFHQSPDRLGPDHLRQFQAQLFRERKLNARTVVQYSAALRVPLRQDAETSLPAGKHSAAEGAADTPNRAEPRRGYYALESASNLMHRAILMTLYAKRARAGRQLLSKNPRVIPAACMYTPTMCPSGLMPFATLEIAPGTSNGTGH